MKILLEKWRLVALLGVVGLSFTWVACGSSTSTPTSTTTSHTITLKGSAS